MVLEGRGSRWEGGGPRRGGHTPHGRRAPAVGPWAWDPAGGDLPAPLPEDASSGRGLTEAMFVAPAAAPSAPSLASVARPSRVSDPPAGAGLDGVRCCRSVGLSSARCELGRRPRGSGREAHPRFVSWLKDARLKRRSRGIPRGQFGAKLSVHIQQVCRGPAVCRHRDSSRQLPTKPGSCPAARGPC